MKKITKLITVSLLASSALYAGSIPTSGDILKQTTPPKFEKEQKILPSITQEYKAPLVVNDKFTTLIKEFKFSGNSIYSSEELNKLVEQYINKQLGVNKLKEITSIITKYYRDNGYFVARAYLPQQKIVDGVVEIAIIEGRYGGFDIKNSSLVKDDTIQNFMDYLKDAQTVSTFSLEKQMLLINDLSGVIVTNAEVYPGEDVGSSNFAITTSPTNKYSGYGIIDNYGSRYTGEYRLSAGANINSVSKVGDTLSFNGMISNTANLKNIATNYKRAIGYSGLNASINASTTRYKLDKIDNYEGFGTSNSLGLGLSYPLVKTRSHTQEVSMDFAYKNMDDSSGTPGLVEESEKSIYSLTLGLSDKRNTNILDKSGKLYSKISFTMGNVNMDNSVAKTNDILIDTKGSYSKANLYISHNQLFNPKLSLQTTLNAQKSFGKNLDSSEDISVGGTNGVRAYEDSELSGDQGISLSLELIYALAKYNYMNQYASLFVDSAKVWKNSKKFNTEDNIRSLNAFGLGYNIYYKNFDCKATFAHGFGSSSTPLSEAEFSTNKNKLLIQAMMRF